MSNDLQPQSAGPDRAQLRALAPIAVFDIAGPLAVYYVARMAGASQVMALILSGIVPALGIVYGIVRNRHVSAIGLLVLAGIIAGTVLGFLTHNPKLVLMEGSVSTLILGLGCFASLATGKPLMFAVISETLGADSPKGKLLRRAWNNPAARPLFTRITIVWGITYLAEVISRVIIIQTFSTGPALTILKLIPWVLTTLLVRWTMRTIDAHPAFTGFIRPVAPAPASTSAPAPASSAAPASASAAAPAMAGHAA